MNKKEWYKNAIFYELHVRAFCDGNNDGIGDLKGLISKLDYLRDLGIGCIWLLPIYPSPLKDDGYDISDFYNIHSDLGTLSDFKQLIKEVHKRDLHIIADLVLNHTSDQCAWFQEARTHPNSPYRNFYVWSDTNQKYKETRIIFIDKENSNWTWDEAAGQYFWHRFYSSQPDLNFDHPLVREEIINILRFWLDLGIDGFRADAVPYLFEREGTSCENLPETHAFLREIRELIDHEYPDRILLAEANQWPSDLSPYFGDGNEFHMAFHFPLMPRIFKALAISDRTPIIKIINETPKIPPNCQWSTFLRNHDELTLEMVSEKDRVFLWNYYAKDTRMRLNLGIRRRLAPLVNGNQKIIELLFAIIFALPGAPIIYYGDEIGMGDNIWLDDRNGVRTPMQWNSKANAGFSNADKKKLFLPIIEEGRFSYQQINVEDQLIIPNSLLLKMRRLIACRKKYEVFSQGTCNFPNLGNQSILAIKREFKGESILAIQNLSDKIIAINPLEYNLKKSYLIDILENNTKNSTNYINDEIRLEPYGFKWFLMKK
ncbi:MAG TPA: maltose alpha-D-glucosyltransferase [Anaerolineae bacterium]|nr:maltose alpha-D-glucosyltransferase [Anaerolineae bacterium]